MSLPDHRPIWFIQEAWKAAVATLANDYPVETADRPDLDHDTQNEAGMVEITAAIFDKILHCATFVADLTPIARTSAGKAIPNPNVAIELGRALKMPGWRRIVRSEERRVGKGWFRPCRTRWWTYH